MKRTSLLVTIEERQVQGRLAACPVQINSGHPLPAMHWVGPIRRQADAVHFSSRGDLRSS